MIASWGAQVLPALAALALCLLPGLPVALLLRARGALLLGIAAGISLAIVAAASLVAPVIGMTWSLVPVIIVTILVSALAFVVRQRSFSEKDIPAAVNQRWEWLTLAIAAVLWLVIVARGIGDPAHPTQLYDGIFHLNAVEFIEKTGDASPLHMTMVLPGATTSFYPTLWHAVVSLIVPVTGSIVVATNVVTTVIIALLWPVGLMTLTRVLFPESVTAPLWASLSSFGFTLFPLGFLNWGVLYPNLLGMLLVPLLVAVVVRAFGTFTAWRERLLWLLCALAVLGATALGHPSAVFGAGAILVPFAVWRTWTGTRPLAAPRRWIARGVLALGVLGFAAFWVRSNVTTNEWLPGVGLRQSLLDALMLNPVGRSMGYLLAPLVLLGIWQVIRLRRWWVLVGYAMTIALYCVASSLRILSLRSAIVGLWYDDTTRVAALLALLALPLAGLGAAFVAELVARGWRSRRRVLSVAVGVLVAALAVTHVSALQVEVRFMSDVSFATGSDTQGLSTDEEELFALVADEIPADAVVIGDPLTGAGLLYAYTGISVVFPHVTGAYGSDAGVLAQRMVSGGTQVCEAIENLDISYALDFGDRVLFEDHPANYDGLHGLDRSPILTEVTRVGDAALYAVTGCGD